MRRATIILLTLTLLLAATPALAITWGQPDGDQHPNVGAMMADWPGWGVTPICTGTLISSRVFLTAGHCIDALDALGLDQAWVSFDPDPASGTLLDVQEWINHPQYGSPSDPHDVGVLILAEPVMGIQPQALPPMGLLDDLNDQGLLKHGQERAKFTAVGYGASLDWPPPQIYYEDVRQYAVTTFQNLHKLWLRASQNNRLDNGGTCYGDSGGPNFWVDPQSQEEILVAITSWGDAVCVSSDFKYRMDIPQSRDFIDAVLSQYP